MEMTYEWAAEILDPAKVNLWENSQFGNCPLCHEVVYRPALRKRVYCCKCGQALNWED